MTEMRPSDQARLTTEYAGIALKEYLEVLIRELDRRLSDAIGDRDTRIDLALAAAKEAVEKALSAAKEAVDKAEISNEKRLELLNEFRGQQADEAKKYALSSNVDLAMHAVDSRISSQVDALNVRATQNARDISQLQGRLIAIAGTGAIFGGIVTAVVIKLTGP